MKQLLRAVKAFDMGLLEFVARDDRAQGEGCCRRRACRLIDVNEQTLGP